MNIELTEYETDLLMRGLDAMCWAGHCDDEEYEPISNLHQKLIDLKANKEL